MEGIKEERRKTYEIATLFIPNYKAFQESWRIKTSQVLPKL
jgi:hypothetical protein